MTHKKVKMIIILFTAIFISSFFINSNETSKQTFHDISAVNVKVNHVEAKEKKPSLYNLEEISIDEYKNTSSYIDSWTVDSGEGKTLPSKYVVEDALKILFDRFNEINIDNLLNGYLQVYIVDGAVQDSNGVYQSGVASLESGHYEVYLFRSYSASEKKKLYHTLVHEVGHLIYANYINHEEMMDYVYTREIPLDYYTGAKWKESREKNVYEMFADDIADWVLPYSYDGDVIVGKGFKDKQEEDVFKDFLVRSMKN